MRAILLSLMVTVSASGCGNADGSDPSAYTVDTLSSGFIQVVNDGRGQWTPENSWTMVEDLRLGSVGQDGPELFSQVAYILTDEAGRIYVLDYPAQDIRVFDDSGQYLHTIGSKGEGPGELQGAAGLDWGPEGDLWVWGGQRYSVFDSEGEFVASYPRLVRGVIYPWIGGFVPGGRYIDWGLDYEVTGREQVGDFLVQSYSGLTTFHPIEFSPPNSLDTLPPLRFYTDVTDDGQMMAPRAGLMVAQAHDGQLWTAITNHYRIVRRTLDGDSLLAFSIPSRPTRVPDQYVDSMMRLSQEQGFPMERDRFGEYERLVTRVLTDNQGLLFVFPHEEGVPEGSVVDVFRETGVYQGRIELPEPVLTRGPPPYFTDTHMYAVVQDELDIPFVVRFRINKQ